MISVGARHTANEESDALVLGWLGLFNYASGTVDITPVGGGPGSSADNTSMNVVVGAGPVYKPSDRTNVAMYGTFEYAQDKTETGTSTETHTATVIPGWNVAAELEAASWLQFRAGLRSKFNFFDDHHEDTGVDTHDKNNSLDYAWTTGVGIHLANFTVDGFLDPSVITSGTDVFGNSEQPVRSGHRELPLLVAVRSELMWRPIPPRGRARCVCATLGPGTPPARRTPMAESLRPERVLEALRHIQDPDLHRDIVDLGFVKDLRIDGGNVAFTIELTTPACPVKESMREAGARRRGGAAGRARRAGADDAQVRNAGGGGAAANALPGIKNIVAVASGKGGVGKSTVAVNLALALQRDGARTGLLDADIYGPSIPIMLGTHAAPPGMRDNQILPVEAHGSCSCRGIPRWSGSTGRLARTDGPQDGEPVPHQCRLGRVDYLVIDLPPEPATRS
jgi:metal-sulfur cluster biosynthetic enzyme